MKKKKMTWYLIYEFFGNRRRELIGIVDTYEDAIHLSSVHALSIIDEYETTEGDDDRGTVILIASYNSDGKVVNI